MCFDPGDTIENVFDDAGKASDAVAEPAVNTIEKTKEIDQIGDIAADVAPIAVMTILGQGAGAAAGLGDLAGAADSVAAGTSDIGVGAGGAGVADTGTTLAEGTAGVSTSGADTLAQPNTTAAVGANAAPSATAPVTGEPGFAGESAPGATIPAKPSGASGLIGGAMDWAKANQGLTAGLLQVGGGALQGMANRESAKEIQERKIQADREAALAKLQNQRDFVQSGSFFGAKVPFRAGANQVLRRADGSPVYPGLVASAMK